jgi:hypothetical protein
MGGGIVYDATGPIERGWFILFCLVYTQNSCFFNFSLDS